MKRTRLDWTIEESMCHAWTRGTFLYQRMQHIILPCDVRSGSLKGAPISATT